QTGVLHWLQVSDSSTVMAIARRESFSVQPSGVSGRITLVGAMPQLLAVLMCSRYAPLSSLYRTSARKPGIDRLLHDVAPGEGQHHVVLHLDPLAGNELAMQAPDHALIHLALVEGPRPVAHLIERVLHHQDGAQQHGVLVGLALFLGEFGEAVLDLLVDLRVDGAARFAEAEGQLQRRTLELTLKLGPLSVQLFDLGLNLTVGRSERSEAPRVFLRLGRLLGQVVDL